MYAILGAVAGAASVGGLVYSTQTSAKHAQSKGRQEGRREVLSQLTTFGPYRLRRMCLELGLRFNTPEDEDEDEERELYEGLTDEIRAVLEAELRESMRAEVEDEVRSVLREEVESDAELMARLRKEAKQLMKNELKKSGVLREEVRTELKREIRVELTRSGNYVALIAKAISDLREETRKTLRSQMMGEVKRELRQEMSWNVKNELRRELRDEVRENLKSELRNEDKSVKAERFLEASASVWTADTALARTKRR